MLDSTHNLRTQNLCWSIVIFLAFSILCLSSASFAKNSSPQELDPLDLLDSPPTKKTQSLPGSAQIPIEKISNPTGQQLESQNLNIEALPREVNEFLSSEKTTRTNVPANFGAQLDGTLPQNDLSLTATSAADAAQQLWKARINAPKQNQESETKNELRRLIERLRSIIIMPQQKSPLPLPVAEEVPADEPNDNNDTPEPLPQLTKEQTELQQTSSLPYKSISPQTLQMLDNLAKDPNRIRNPFELAEVLFQSGFLKEAIPFYQQALIRCTPDPNDHSQNRAWILFQLGNCLQTENPQAAIEMYKQLITEFPDSMWTAMAKAREQLITWYQQDQPKTFIVKTDF